MKRIFLVLILLSVIISPCFAAGKIKVISPGDNYQVFLGSLRLDVSSGSKTVIVLAGDHEVSVKDSAGNIIFDEQVIVENGKVTEIDLASKIKETGSTKAVSPVPAKNAIEAAKNVNEAQVHKKKMTIRPIYALANTINVNVSNDDYGGSGLKATYVMDLNVDSGIGLAFDYAIWENDNESNGLLVGASYLQQSIKTVNGKGTLTGFPAKTYKDTAVEVQSALTALYLKYRSLLWGGQQGANIFWGAKLSYNLINISGDLNGSASLPGFGVFTDIGLNDEYDIEIAFDSTQGPIANYDDGTDSFKGTFTQSSILSASVGYKF